MYKISACIHWTSTLILCPRNLAPLLGVSLVSLLAGGGAGSAPAELQLGSSTYLLAWSLPCACCPPMQQVLLASPTTTSIEINRASQKKLSFRFFSAGHIKTQIWAILGILGISGQFWVFWEFRAFLGISDQFWTILGILGNF